MYRLFVSGRMDFPFCKPFVFPLEFVVLFARPFRRYLISHDHGCFPTSVEPVLECVALQARGLAARTWFKDFVGTLRFFEGAGERATDDLLHLLPSLQSLTAEATSAGVPQRPAGMPLRASSNSFGATPA